jgi:hypothetical protein
MTGTDVIRDYLLKTRHHGSLRQEIRSQHCYHCLDIFLIDVLPAVGNHF